MIKPLIHRNAIASLDWIGRSAPVPLHTVGKFKSKTREVYICSMVHARTHAPRQRGFFGRCISGSDDCVFTRNQKWAEKCKTREIRSDVSMCYHQRGHREFPSLLHGFEPKYLTQWPNEHSDSAEHHGLSSHHSGRRRLLGGRWSTG